MAIYHGKLLDGLLIFYCHEVNRYFVIVDFCSFSMWGRIKLGFTM